MSFSLRSILFLSFLTLVNAQGSGTLTGVINEANNKSGLPGVNVMVKGTYYGAASDLEGRYRIDNISPGSYDIEVSMIGYKIILKTGVTIGPGEIIDLDFHMEETVLSFGEDMDFLPDAHLESPLVFDDCYALNPFRKFQKKA